MVTSALARTSKIPRATLLALCSLLLALSPLASRVALAKNASGKAVVVSMGDSYSSGEGNEPFYGQDSADKYSNEDWLAHRSELAWPGKLQIGGTTLVDGKDDHWFFVAASGALISHVTTEEETRTWSGNSESGTHQLPIQISMFSKNGLKGSVDYVTITLGGNDFGFRDIMTTAATELPFIGSGSLDAKIEQAVASLDTTIMPALKETYQSVLDAAGDQATLVVVGYPHLLYESIFGSLLFSSSEAKSINSGIDEFDAKLSDLIASMNNERIVYVDPRAAFSGHEAYAPDEYINEVSLGAGDQDLDQSCTVSEYSLHPNEKGQTAYASVVQVAIDELEAAHAIDPTVAVKGIQVSPTTASLIVGDTTQLGATVTPADATNKNYTWSSTNPAVATVDAAGLVTAVGAGSAKIVATTEDGAYTGSCDVTVYAPAKPTDDGVPVYRMYNRVTSEHMYTTNSTEYAACGKGSYADWQPEGTAWVSPTEGTEGAMPVYRLYNAGLGDHHYTTDETERSTLVAQYGWTSEGVAFYSGGDIPVYRLYNGKLKRGQHHYTTSLGEHDSLVANHGWSSEGTALYGLASQ